MYKKLIDDFYNENEVKDKTFPSAQALAHFQLRLLLNPDFSDKLLGIIDDTVFDGQPDREEMVMAEKKAIESITNYEDIIRLMRRRIDNMSHNTLVYHAMKFQDEVVPEIIRRLKTSLNDVFIEIATKVLTMCSVDIANDLIEYYDDVRNPYAQSMILLVLGFRADEAHIPWMIEKHNILKRMYPDETYSDSVIFALADMEDRFYR